MQYCFDLLDTGKFFSVPDSVSPTVAVEAIPHEALTPAPAAALLKAALLLTMGVHEGVIPVLGASHLIAALIRVLLAVGCIKLQRRIEVIEEIRMAHGFKVF